MLICRHILQCTHFSLPLFTLFGTVFSRSLRRMDGNLQLVYKNKPDSRFRKLHLKYSKVFCQNRLRLQSLLFWKVVDTVVIYKITSVCACINNDVHHLLRITSWSRCYPLDVYFDTSYRLWLPPNQMNMHNFNFDLYLYLINNSNSLNLHRLKERYRNILIPY